MKNKTKKYKVSEESNLLRGQFEGVTGFFHLAGFRFWTASLLPALVGTTLPFWLRPPDFVFRWFGAIEFLFAAVLFQSGFSFLRAWFDEKNNTKYPKSRLLMYAGMSIVLACLLGLHINSTLQLNKYVYEGIFIVFGFSAIIVGVLYVVPPFKLGNHFFGAIFISYSFGFLPVLGAYIIQVGDITRTVYVASLPLVIATGLWVWTEELSRRTNDEKVGRKTMVMLFSQRFSARYGVLSLSILLFVSLLIAILSKSLPGLTLSALLLFGLVWKIVVISRKEYSNSERMFYVCRKVFVLHLIFCSIIAVSTIVELLL